MRKTGIHYFLVNICFNNDRSKLLGDLATTLSLLERKDGRMNVNLLEELSNVDHKRFKLVLDFLVKFKFMEYNSCNQTVKLNDSLLFMQLNQELSLEQKFVN